MNGRRDTTEAVILAGTFSWDDPSFDMTILRPLLPVGGVPLICRILTWLSGGGLWRTTVCANSASRLVRGYLRDGAELGVSLYYYEDLIPRGPAGCVKDATVDSNTRTVVVVDGTVIPGVSLTRLLDCHKATEAVATVVVAEDDLCGPSPGERMKPAGICVFDRRALDHVHETSYEDIKEMLIPRLYASGERVQAYVADGPCPRVTSVATYLAVNDWLLERMTERADAPFGYRPLEAAWVHPKAEVASGANVIGPVCIGPESRVEAGATVVGPTSIGSHCVIESGAVASRSILWDRCKVRRGAVVDRCVLTNDATVEVEERLRGRVCGATDRARNSILRRLIRGRRTFATWGTGPADHRDPNPRAAGWEGERPSELTGQSAGRTERS